MNTSLASALENGLVTATAANSLSKHLVGGGNVSSRCLALHNHPSLGANATTAGTDTCSLASASSTTVDVADSNDLKFMDDSTSSSSSLSSSSMSGTVPDIDCPSNNSKQQLTNLATADHTSNSPTSTRSPDAALKLSTSPPTRNHIPALPPLVSVSPSAKSIAAAAAAAASFSSPSRIPVPKRPTSAGLVSAKHQRTSPTSLSPRSLSEGYRASFDGVDGDNERWSNGTQFGDDEDVINGNGHCSLNGASPTPSPMATNGVHIDQPDHVYTSNATPINRPVDSWSYLRAKPHELAPTMDPSILRDCTSIISAPNLDSTTTNGIDLMMSYPHHHHQQQHYNSADHAELVNDENARFRDLLAFISDSSESSSSDTESIAESIYHQPPKAADRGAASRLAKRLFQLDGFRITDVAKHLCKRNDFSQMVGEEFASFFDFTGQRLDVAMRAFLNSFSLTGETQERERTLVHFSRRYHACNVEIYSTEDACHTLVCALMLLNVDLHSPGITRKMTCQEFINNLLQTHCGDCYSRDDLKTLYNAIKQEPVRWPHSDAGLMSFVNFYYPTTSTALGPAVQLPPGYLTPSGFYAPPTTTTTAGLYGPNGIGANPYQPQHPSYQPYPLGMLAGPNAPNVPNLNQPLMYPGPNGLLPPSAFYWGAGSGGPALTGAGIPSMARTTTGGVASLTTTASTALATLPTSINSDRPVARKLSGGNSLSDLAMETNAREYMRGFLVRKWVMESHGKKASLGRRGWKVYYARLRDLVLYLYKNAVMANTASRAEEVHLIYQHQQQQQQQQIQMQQQLIHHHHQQQLMLQEQQQAQVPAEPASSESVESNGLESVEDPAETDACDEANGEPAVDVSVNGQPDGEVPAACTEDTVDDSADSQSNTPSHSPVATDSQAVAPEPFVVQNPQDPDVSAHSVVSTPAKLSIPPSPPASMELPLSIANCVQQQQPAFVPPVIPPPEAVVRIAHAFASRATDYLKRNNVFRLRTRDGAEYLFEVTDEKELDLWIERINFVAALLSAPAMSGPVSSERGVHRPHLPITCTKLNIREQLEEHQRRLIDLDRELREMQKRSGACRPQKSRSLSVTSNDESPKQQRGPTGLEETESQEGTNGTIDPLESGDSVATDGGSSDPAPTAASTKASPSCTPVASTASSIISVFSTASLGRRRKTSTGSLASISVDGLSMTTKQRAELEERIQFTELEIQRYKTYARLLEAELFRIQQSSAAVAHAAAMAAANSFSPYMNPYGPFPAGMVSPLQTIGLGSPFPPAAANSMSGAPRYFFPRTMSPGPTNLVPLAVLGPQDSLNEEQSPDATSNPPASTSVPSSSTDTPEYEITHSTVTTSVAPVSTATQIQLRPRAMSLYSLSGSQVPPPSPYSPSTAGRFYSHPRHWRSPIHSRLQGMFGSTVGRTNGLHLNGNRLPEEDSSTTADTAGGPIMTTTTTSAALATSSAENGHGSSNHTTIGGTNGDKLKSIQSIGNTSTAANSLNPTDGVFYEIV